MKAISVLPAPSHGLSRLTKMLKDPQLRFAYTAVVPMIVWYGIFAVWALVRGVSLAFMSYHLINPDLNKFVGFRNFTAVLHDAQFPLALGNSAIWGVLGNVVGVPLCLGIALCLVSVKRGRTLYQTLIFIPVVMSLISVIVLVRYLLDTDIGPIDHLLAKLHLPTSTFLQGTATALPSLVGFALWKGSGVTIVILTAGLLNIPGELMDAARVDGTNAWQRFWRVILPLMQPTLNFVIVLGVISSLQTYTEPKVMTNGGPVNSTYMLNMYIYDTGFGNLQFGQAAAASLIEFAITLFLTLVVLRLLQLRWSY